MSKTYNILLNQKQSSIKGDFMESIVDTLTTVPSVDDNSEYFKKLKEAGFSCPISGYQEITVIAILQFLSNKIMHEKKKLGFKPKIKSHEIVENRITQEFLPPFKSNYSWNRQLLAWNETRVGDFIGTPPQHVLDAVIRARKSFQDIRIVTVGYEDSPIPDPLVVGVKSGRRFLIDYWDKDIDPTEI